MVTLLKYPIGASNLIPYWRAEVDLDFHPSEIGTIMPAGTARIVGTVVRACAP